MRADIRTDMTKLIVAFLNFAIAPKNQQGIKTETFIDKCS